MAAGNSIALVAVVPITVVPVALVPMPAVVVPITVVPIAVVPMPVGVVMDLRDHAVRLMKRRGRHCLRRCCNGQGSKAAKAINLIIFSSH